MTVQLVLKKIENEESKADFDTFCTKDLKMGFGSEQTL